MPPSKKEGNDPWGDNGGGFPSSSSTVTTDDPVWNESNDPFAASAVTDPTYESPNFFDAGFDVDGDGAEGDGHGAPGGKVPPHAATGKVALSPVAICSVIGVANFIQGGIVGGAVGTMHAVADGFTTGARHDPGFGRYVLAAGGASAVSFGAWLGTYTSTKCVLKVSRGKSDLANSFGAGLLAGCVSSLRAGNARVILASGVTSGVLMTALDAFSLATKAA
jgi:hypothetical protein